MRQKSLKDKNNIKKHTEADERLYRFSEICRATLQNKPDEAFKLMRSQALFMYEEQDLRLFRVFLNAMNQAHYHLFLNEFDLSLHELCFANGQVLHRVNDWEDFLKAGKHILHSYAEAAAGLHKEDNEAVPSAIRYIRANLDKDLSLQSIAEHVYLNKTYFCTLFKEVTGQNISLFIRKERMRRAEQLLSGTDMLIEDIAKRCGFNSPAYFSTVFREFFNMQPSEYRNRSREPQ